MPVRVESWIELSDGQVIKELKEAIAFRERVRARKLSYEQVLDVLIYCGPLTPADLVNHEREFFGHDWEEFHFDDLPEHPPRKSSEPIYEPIDISIQINEPARLLSADEDRNHKGKILETYLYAIYPRNQESDIPIIVEVLGKPLFTSNDHNKESDELKVTACDILNTLIAQISQPSETD